MKKFLAVTLLLLVSASVGLAQGYAQRVAPIVEYIQLNDSTLIGATYAASQKDTTVGYALSGWEDVYLVFTTTDSASFKVQYFPSYDGATFDDLSILIDSVSTQGDGASAANGISYSMALPKACLGYPAVKFEIIFNSYGNGVTTPKYSGKLVKK